MNEKCYFDYQIRRVTLAEAIARYQQRPDSAWEMFRRLKNTYTEWTNKTFEVTLKQVVEFPEQEAITIMKQIEKELKGE